MGLYELIGVLEDKGSNSESSYVFALHIYITDDFGKALTVSAAVYSYLSESRYLSEGVTIFAFVNISEVQLQHEIVSSLSTSPVNLPLPTSFPRIAHPS